MTIFAVMDWSDDAIVLTVRPLGESGAIVEALTRAHGRHLGLVRGGASRRMKPVLQPGNTLHLHWRARLSNISAASRSSSPAPAPGELMDGRESLIGLNALTAAASAAMPEREAHENVFAAGEILLDAMMEDGLDHWGPLYVRWEAGLLDALGFGLDLSHCAATGATEDLVYVSPRSGRAVSRSRRRGVQGAAVRAAALPARLAERRGAGRHRRGLKLTGYFLLERVLAPHGKEMPAPRLRLMSWRRAKS